MPKISKKSIKIDQGDIAQHVEFTIHYSGEYGFWAEIPDRLNEQFDQLTDKELKQLSAGKKPLQKYRADPHKKVVKATTEEGVVKAMQKLLEKMLTLSLKKEPVIIVRFDDDRAHSRYGDRDNDLETIGMSLSAIFCFEVSAGAEARYYKYSTYNMGGEEHISRSEIRLSKGDGLVIPDTPENRKFITDLHGALNLLIDQMVKFAKSRESMLEIIAKQQKLITFEPQNDATKTSISKVSPLAAEAEEEADTEDLS